MPGGGGEGEEKNDMEHWLTCGLDNEYPGQLQRLSGRAVGARAWSSSSSAQVGGVWGSRPACWGQSKRPPALTWLRLLAARLLFSESVGSPSCHNAAAQVSAGRVLFASNVQVPSRWSSERSFATAQSPSTVVRPRLYCTVCCWPGFNTSHLNNIHRPFYLTDITSAFVWDFFSSSPPLVECGFYH
jgi:hypothetical protein